MIEIMIFTKVESFSDMIMGNPFVECCKVVVQIISITENWLLDFGIVGSEEEEPQDAVVMREHDKK